MGLLSRPTGLPLLNEVRYGGVSVKSLSAQTYGFKGIATLPAPTAGIVRQGDHLNGVIEQAYRPTPPQ